MRVEEAVVVAREPAEVFAVLTDPGMVERWQQGVTGTRVEGPAGVGSRMSGTREFAGMRVAWTTEVTAWDPPRRLAFRSVGTPVRLTGDQVLTAVPGGTRVTASMEFAVPAFGLLRLSDRVGERVAAELRRDLAALKALVEAR